MSTCKVGAEGGLGPACCALILRLPGTGRQQAGDEVPGAEGQTSISGAIASPVGTWVPAPGMKGTQGDAGMEMDWLGLTLSLTPLTTPDTDLL